MVEKEIWMQAIAHNMIRALILETALSHHVDIERLSFKGSIDTLRSWLPLFLPGKPRKNQRLLLLLSSLIASDLVHLRPLRSEPRAKNADQKTSSS
ncbi:MAG: hypothetical protein LBK99_21130 [Opitutaceae bacterium]|jgi:hypothetical protein|nr:hypothetical protein [Opitutaceae bacterium]